MYRQNKLTAARFEPKPILLMAGVALCSGLLFGLLSISALLLVVFALAVVLLIALRQDEVTAAVIIGVNILFDWYQLLGAPLHLAVIALVIALALAGTIFFTQSPARPWVSIPRLRLWVLLLVLAALPALRGSSLSQSALYYANIFGSALLMYLLGVQVARDLGKVRRLLGLLAGFGALVGLHSIILSETGTFLLATPHITNYLVAANFFRIAGSQTSRAGSFLLNPDWNGAFLGMLLFIPLGLLLASSSRRAKFLYLGEFLLLLGGLYVTYSLSSLLAAAIGLVVFLLLVVRGRVFLYFFGAAGVVAGAILLVLHAHLSLLLSHASTAGEFSLRLGGWETALQIIRAHPLGIGLGLQTYARVEGAYRAPLEYRPLVHPHESYLELGALAGLPVLLVFLALLGSLFWLALRTYRRAARRERALLGSALAAIVVLSVNSLGVNAWTLAPLAATGWLILGALSSPALAHTLRPQPSSSASALPVSVARERPVISVRGGA